MTEKLTRKEFFCEVLRRSIDVLGELSTVLEPDERLGEKAKENALWSDLSPALLEMEAARLGCDATDKDAVARAVAAELSRSD